MLFFKLIMIVCLMNGVNSRFPVRKKSPPHRKVQIKRCDCGRTTENTTIVRPFIVNGNGQRPAYQGEIPWRCRVVTSLTSCGCTIVNERWVLTAAHCLSYLQNDSSSVIVYAGDIDLEKQVAIKADKMVIPESYLNATFTKDDIALVRLSGSGLKLSPNVRPVCLPFKYTSKDFTGAEAMISGWGKINSMPNDWTTPKTLQTAKVKVIGQEACKAVFPQVATDATLCTNAMDDSVCSGDSGGSLDFSDGLRTYAIGVVSWVQAMCPLGRYPNGYTRVTMYLKWILQNIDGKICRPS